RRRLLRVKLDHGDLLAPKNVKCIKALIARVVIVRVQLVVVCIEYYGTCRTEGILLRFIKKLSDGFNRIVGDFHGIASPCMEFVDVEIIIRGADYGKRITVVKSTVAVERIFGIDSFPALRTEVPRE